MRLAGGFAQVNVDSDNLKDIFLSLENRPYFRMKGSLCPFKTCIQNFNMIGQVTS